MRLCLAGTFPSEKIVRENRPEYVLESFFYIKPWQVEEMPKWKMFLLDSGAGSPPRVRGKDIKQAIHIMLQRITPACAGKRAASAREAYFIWDHPRVCGEKPIPANNGKTIEGSPPRMWGKAPVLPA